MIFHVNVERQNGIFEMTYDLKRKTLALLGLVMILMVIISASLTRLEFHPGMPVPSLENGQVRLVPIEEEPGVFISVSEVFNVLFIIVLAGMISYMAYRMIRGVEWKVLGSFIQQILVIFLFAISIIFLILLLIPKEQNVSPMEMPIPTPAPLVTTPLEPVPEMLLWVIGILLLAGTIALGIWIFAPGSTRLTTADLVGLEAEKAWQALMTGQDLKNVVIQCYRQMGLAFAREQGIKRKDFMTTREFENLLKTAGVPHDPIHQLTGLFEAVRYGNWHPNPVDEQKAIHCFHEIMAHCRDPRQGD